MVRFMDSAFHWKQNRSLNLTARRNIDNHLVDRQHTCLPQARDQSLGDMDLGVAGVLSNQLQAVLKILETLFVCFEVKSFPLPANVKDHPTLTWKRALIVSSGFKSR
jgi:hypothetical protein